MDAILSIAALISFALLIVAWLALPNPAARQQPESASIGRMEREPAGA